MKTQKQLLFSVVLVVFLLIGRITKTGAEERKGTIRSIDEIVLSSGAHRLSLSVDTTGNRIANAYILFPSPYDSAISKNLQQFVERGMEIIFDDEGHMVLYNGDIQVNGDNTISIDGDNMIFLFPNEENRFKFAVQVYDRRRKE
jgi:hypothetical protein